MSRKSPSPPENLNPWSVLAQRSAGKKRLILVLRHISLHVHQQKFQCEGLHTFKSIFFLESVSFFLFTFWMALCRHFSRSSKVFGVLERFR